MSRYRSASLENFNDITNEDFQIEVVMLDGRELYVALKKNTVGQLLFDKICECVDLVEKEYFGLVYSLSEDGTRQWLDLTKPVEKFLKSPFILSCEVKFYPRDPDLVQDALTQNYMYRQAKKDLLNSRIEASFSTYALLGSFMVQHEYGDFNENSVNYIKKIPFAPIGYPDMEMIRNKVIQLHPLHKGISSSAAQLLYLQNVKKLHLYGVHLIKVINEYKERVRIGVCASGIIIFKKNQQIDYKFSWPKINKVRCQDYNFYLKIKSSVEREDGIHFFIFPSTSIAKTFFRNCKEHHLFFRCSVQSNEKIFNSSYGTIYDDDEMNDSFKLSYEEQSEPENESAGPIAASSMPVIVKIVTKEIINKDKNGVTQNTEEMIEDGRTGEITHTTQMNKSDAPIDGDSPFVSARAVTTRTATTHEDLERNARTQQMEEKTVAQSMTSNATGQQQQHTVTKEVKTTSTVVGRRDSISSASSDDSGTPIDPPDDPNHPYYNSTIYNEVPVGRVIQTEINNSYQGISPSIGGNIPIGGEIVSSQTINSKTRTVETITYKTEHDGVVETRVEQKITIQSDGDPTVHNRALEEAIQEATVSNPDLMVEKIEIQQTPSK